MSSERKKKEDLFELLQAHHLGVGESLSFRCPHCRKEVTVELKALEGDPDTIEVYWGRSFEEIEEKKRKAEKEI